MKTRHLYRVYVIDNNEVEDAQTQYKRLADERGILPDQWTVASYGEEFSSLFFTTMPQHLPSKLLNKLKEERDKFFRELEHKIKLVSHNPRKLQKFLHKEISQLSHLLRHILSSLPYSVDDLVVEEIVKALDEIHTTAELNDYFTKVIEKVEKYQQINNVYYETNKEFNRGIKIDGKGVTTQEAKGPEAVEHFRATLISKGAQESLVDFLLQYLNQKYIIVGTNFLVNPFSEVTTLLASQGITPSSDKKMETNITVEPDGSLLLTFEQKYYDTFEIGISGETQARAYLQVWVKPSLETTNLPYGDVTVKINEGYLGIYNPALRDIFSKIRLKRAVKNIREGIKLSTNDQLAIDLYVNSFKTSENKLDQDKLQDIDNDQLFILMWANLIDAWTLLFEKGFSPEAFFSRPPAEIRRDLNIIKGRHNYSNQKFKRKVDSLTQLMSYIETKDIKAIEKELSDSGDKQEISNEKELSDLERKQADLKRKQEISNCLFSSGISQQDNENDISFIEKLINQPSIKNYLSPEVLTHFALKDSSIAKSLLYPPFIERFKFQMRTIFGLTGNGEQLPYRRFTSPQLKNILQAYPSFWNTLFTKTKKTFFNFFSFRPNYRSRLEAQELKELIDVNQPRGLSFENSVDEITNDPELYAKVTGDKEQIALSDSIVYLKENRKVRLDDLFSKNRAMWDEIHNNLSDRELFRLYREKFEQEYQAIDAKLIILIEDLWRDKQGNAPFKLRWSESIHDKYRNKLPIIRKALIAVVGNKKFNNDPSLEFKVTDCELPESISLAEVFISKPFENAYKSEVFSPKQMKRLQSALLDNKQTFKSLFTVSTMSTTKIQTLVEQLIDRIPRLDPDGCDLVLISSPPPTKKTISNLRIKSNAAYVYVRGIDKLFYVNKDNKECIEIELDKKKLEEFRAKMIPSNEVKTLSKGQLDEIKRITDRPIHKNNRRIKKTTLRNQLPFSNEDFIKLIKYSPVLSEIFKQVFNHADIKELIKNDYSLFSSEKDLKGEILPKDNNKVYTLTNKLFANKELMKSLSQYPDLHELFLEMLAHTRFMLNIKDEQDLFLFKKTWKIVKHQCPERIIELTTLLPADKFEKWLNENSYPQYNGLPPEGKKYSNECGYIIDNLISDNSFYEKFIRLHPESIQKFLLRKASLTQRVLLFLNREEFGNLYLDSLTKVKGNYETLLTSRNDFSSFLEQCSKSDLGLLITKYPKLLKIIKKAHLYAKFSSNIESALRDAYLAIDFGDTLTLTNVNSYIEDLFQELSLSKGIEANLKSQLSILLLARNASDICTYLVKYMKSEEYRKEDLLFFLKDRQLIQKIINSADEKSIESLGKLCKQLNEKEERDEFLPQYMNMIIQRMIIDPKFRMAAMENKVLIGLANDHGEPQLLAKFLAIRSQSLSAWFEALSRIAADPKLFKQYLFLLKGCNDFTGWWFYHLNEHDDIPEQLSSKNQPLLSNEEIINFIERPGYSFNQFAKLILKQYELGYYEPNLREILASNLNLKARQIFLKQSFRDNNYELTFKILMNELDVNHKSDLAKDILNSPFINYLLENVSNEDLTRLLSKLSSIDLDAYDFVVSQLLILCSENIQIRSKVLDNSSRVMLDREPEELAVSPLLVECLKFGLENYRCYLHWMPDLPKKLYEYKNSYILVDTQLYYIRLDGSSEQVIKNVTPNFLRKLADISQNNSGKIALSKRQVENLITSNWPHDLSNQPLAFEMLLSAFNDSEIAPDLITIIDNSEPVVRNLFTESGNGNQLIEYFLFLASNSGENNPGLEDGINKLLGDKKIFAKMFGTGINPKLKQRLIIQLFSMLEVPDEHLISNSLIREGLNDLKLLDPEALARLLLELSADDTIDLYLKDGVVLKVGDEKKYYLQEAIENNAILLNRVLLLANENKLLELLSADTDFLEIYVKKALGGCDFHIMNKFPENLKAYNNNYILVHNKLYFISPSKEGKSIKIEIEIDNPTNFLNALRNIGPHENKIYLSYAELNQLITSNGGHNPLQQNTVATTLIERLGDGSSLLGNKIVNFLASNLTGNNFNYQLKLMKQNKNLYNAFLREFEVMPELLMKNKEEFDRYLSFIIQEGTAQDLYRLLEAFKKGADMNKEVLRFICNKIRGDHQPEAGKLVNYLNTNEDFKYSFFTSTIKNLSFDELLRLVSTEAVEEQFISYLNNNDDILKGLFDRQVGNFIAYFKQSRQKLKLYFLVNEKFPKLELTKELNNTVERNSVFARLLIVTANASDLVKIINNEAERDVDIMSTIIFNKFAPKVFERLEDINEDIMFSEQMRIAINKDHANTEAFLQRFSSFNTNDSFDDSSTKILPLCYSDRPNIPLSINHRMAYFYALRSRLLWSLKKEEGKHHILNYDYIKSVRKFVTYDNEGNLIFKGSKDVIHLPYAITYFEAQARYFYYLDHKTAIKTLIDSKPILRENLKETLTFDENGVPAFRKFDVSANLTTDSEVPAFYLHTVLYAHCHQNQQEKVNLPLAKAFLRSVSCKNGKIYFNSIDEDVKVPEKYHSAVLNSALVWATNEPKTFVGTKQIMILQKQLHFNAIVSDTSVSDTSHLLKNILNSVYMNKQGKMICKDTQEEATSKYRKMIGELLISSGSINPDPTLTIYLQAKKDGTDYWELLNQTEIGQLLLDCIYVNDKGLVLFNESNIKVPPDYLEIVESILKRKELDTIINTNEIALMGKLLNQLDLGNHRKHCKHILKNIVIGSEGTEMEGKLVFQSNNQPIPLFLVGLYARICDIELDKNTKDEFDNQYYKFPCLQEDVEIGMQYCQEKKQDPSPELDRLPTFGVEGVGNKQVIDRYCFFSIPSLLPLPIDNSEDVNNRFAKVDGSQEISTSV